MKKQALFTLIGIGLLFAGCKQQGGTDQQVADMSIGTLSDTRFVKDETSTEEVAVSVVTFDDEQAQNILEAYFKKFAEEEFDALQDYYTPQVKQYITLKNIKAEEVSKIASDFFTNKTNIFYAPDFSRFHLQSQGEYFETTLPLKMQWSETRGEEQEENGTYYNRTAEVLLGITMNQDYKIVSYLEKKVIKPKYKLLQGLTAYSVDQEGVSLELPEGAIVTDHFEKKYTMGLGPQLKVIYQGKAYWIQEYKEGFGRAGIRLLVRVE